MAKSENANPCFASRTPNRARRARRPNRPSTPCCAGRATIPTREGLRDTPARVARAFEDWFSGYDQDPGRLSRAAPSRKSKAMTTW